MSGLLPATCALQIAFYIPHTYYYRSFPAPKLKRNKSKVPWAFHWLKGKQILPFALVSECATQKKNSGPYPFTFSLASVSILQSSWLYALALSPLIWSYLSNFNMNYITFRTVEIGKLNLFKEKKLWKKIKSVLICSRIFFLHEIFKIK